MEKIYKKGTKIKMFASCNFVGCDMEDEFTLEHDMTETEVNQLVDDFVMESIQPDGYFKVIAENEEE
jgi:hypothetical protein